MRSMQLILGRPVLKTDVVYTTQSTESAQGTKYTCTVTLPQYDASANYRGQAAESAKLAETKAAEVAVRALAKIVAPLEEERKAKKAKQNQEQLAKLKEATKAKKERSVLLGCQLSSDILCAEDCIHNCTNGVRRNFAGCVPAFDRLGQSWIC